MREHGIRGQEVSASGGIRIAIHGNPGNGGPNPESPAFEAAQCACQQAACRPEATEARPLQRSMELDAARGGGSA